MTSNYQYKPSQEQRILNLLRERGQQGVFVYEIMTPQLNGLGIAQYNARIYGLREKGFDIQNKKPGHFVLVTKEKPHSIADAFRKKRQERIAELEKTQVKLF